MIVQGQLSEEERLKVLKEAREIEIALDKADSDAQSICARLNRLSAEYEARIESYLQMTGLSDRMGVDKITEQFSPFTRDITYETLTAAGTITREHKKKSVLKGYPPNSITEVVSDLMMEYCLKRAEMDGEIFIVGTAEFELNYMLLDKAFAEMPFPPKNSGKATLFTTSTPGYFYGMRANLSAAERDEFVFHVDSSSLNQLMDCSDMYMITRVSSRTPAVAAMHFVLDKIQKKYDNDNQIIREANRMTWQDKYGMTHKV